VKRSDLRGLSYGKEKTELLHVVRVLRQAAWSEAIYAAFAPSKGITQGQIILSTRPNCSSMFT
jgi:hypothetical protein